MYWNVMKTQQSSPLKLRCCGLSCECNKTLNCLLSKAIRLHKNNNTYGIYDHHHLQYSFLVVDYGHGKSGLPTKD
jgi:hypothetical protein